MKIAVNDGWNENNGAGGVPDGATGTFSYDSATQGASTTVSQGLETLAALAPRPAETRVEEARAAAAPS